MFKEPEPRTIFCHYWDKPYRLFLMFLDSTLRNTVFLPLFFHQIPAARSGVDMFEHYHWQSATTSRRQFKWVSDKWTRWRWWAVHRHPSQLPNCDQPGALRPVQRRLLCRRISCHVVVPIANADAQANPAQCSAPRRGSQTSHTSSFTHCCSRFFSRQVFYFYTYIILVILVTTCTIKLLKPPSLSW